jgi:hypothetical protein
MHHKASSGKAGAQVVLITDAITTGGHYCPIFFR